jgi:cellulose synthase/poly-beta-1,6-N-acetylglucosamine synthase-like glycosyltransferase
MPGSTRAAPSSGARAGDGIDAVTVSALLAVLVMGAVAAGRVWPDAIGVALGWSLPAQLAVPARLFDLAVSALGVLSLLVVAAAAAHLAEGLWRRRRPFALGLAVLAFVLAFTPAGVAVVWFVCGVVVVANAFAYTYLAAKALLRMRRGRGLTPTRDAAPPSALPGVTVVVPARDEDAVIEETLRALDRALYAEDRLDIVVIDDGSVDQTRARVEALAPELTRPLRLVTHDRSQGKASRLNQLLPQLESEFVLLLDADHHVAPDLLMRLLPHFAPGADVACAQAASAVRNGGLNWLTRALEMEYLFRCQGTYPGKPMAIFVGSGGLFRRSALLAAGGFDPNMLTEDVELSYRLYARGQRIAYEPEACTLELAAIDFRNFFNQRYRWMRGLWQAMLLHAPRATRASGARRALPYFIQCTSDGLIALCLSVLSLYVFLEQLGAVAPQSRVPLYAILLTSPFAFGVGFIRGRRSVLSLYLPLVPLYAVLHAIPMAWALIDGYVLGKPAVWVKTDRGAERRASRHTQPRSRAAAGVRV